MSRHDMSKQHVADSRLQLLVFGDEDSDEYRSTAIHVETCSMCRGRLARLTGADGGLAEVGALLGGYAKGLECIEADRESSDSHTVDFLSPPTHPEMLGRLGRYDIERVIGAGGMGVVLKDTSRVSCTGT